MQFKTLKPNFYQLTDCYASRESQMALQRHAGPSRVRVDCGVRNPVTEKCG
jgi:hypothetical protein